MMRIPFMNWQQEQLNVPTVVTIMRYKVMIYHEHFKEKKCYSYNKV